MACAICNTRKPRRFCPGVRGDICTLCCGEEREVTVDCPLDCVFLAEARKHEHRAKVREEDFPNRDIRINEDFVEEHALLFTAMGAGMLSAGLETEGAVDSDVRDALDALIQTYRTLQSGVYYETRPENALASRIFGSMQSTLEKYREKEAREMAVRRASDGDVLRMLVLLQQMELTTHNGRRRSRAFLDSLREYFSGLAERTPERAVAPSLIVP